ncbi:MAG: hypothetical protein COA79_25565 [Planctomycetota bacterium]|nr:MAG: hypothetical protein COA79_25565 [Planctomycetota bacterium]
MNFKDLYLPLGLVSIIILSTLIPSVGELLYNLEWYSIKISHVLIFFIFLISGYTLKLNDIKLNRELILVLIIGGLINLIGAPIVAFIILKMDLVSSNALSLGIIAIACVPPTLVSGIVITDIAKGDTALAIVITIFLNIAGIFILPFTFQYFGQTDATEPISSLKILYKLLILVIAPSIIGFLIKRKLQKKAHPFLSYYQPTAIIFIVFCTAAAGNENIKNITIAELFFLIITVLSIHLILLLMCKFSGQLIGLAVEKQMALSFVCSQKTLPVSLTILIAFPKEITALASIACLIFHLSQIFADSFIALQWKKHRLKKI